MLDSALYCEKENVLVTEISDMQEIAMLSQRAEHIPEN